MPLVWYLVHNEWKYKGSLDPHTEQPDLSHLLFFANIEHINQTHWILAHLSRIYLMDSSQSFYSSNLWSIVEKIAHSYLYKLWLLFSIVDVQYAKK